MYCQFSPDFCQSCTLLSLSPHSLWSEIPSLNQLTMLLTPLTANFVSTATMNIDNEPRHKIPKPLHRPTYPPFSLSKWIYAITSHRFKQIFCPNSAKPERSVSLSTVVNCWKQLDCLKISDLQHQSHIQKPMWFTEDIIAWIQITLRYMHTQGRDA